MLREYRITVSGQVQGVFFRAKTKGHADQLGLKGTVRNLSNGDVEICVGGTKEDAELLIQKMKDEPLPIQIDSVTITECSSKQPYLDFEVIY